MPSSRLSNFALTSAGRVRLFSTDEVLNMPPPTWLVDGIIPTSGVVGLYGPSGCGKSFVSIDLAMCVASGTPWHGHEVQQGLVVYISAEGTSGIGRRAMAWLTTHGKQPRDVNVAWAVEAVPIYYESEDLQTLFDRFDELQAVPALVIIDTLARCFEGDENETQDMGNFVKGIDRLRNECGSTVLVVHHTNTSEARERGSGSFRNASDTMIRMMPGVLGAGVRSALRPAQGSFTLICDKQKEAVPFNVGVGTLLDVAETHSATPHIEWLTDKETEGLL